MTDKPATTNDVLDAFWIEHRGPHWERNTRHRKHCLEAGYRRGYADALLAAEERLRAMLYTPYPEPCLPEQAPYYSGIEDAADEVASMKERDK